MKFNLLIYVILFFTQFTLAQKLVYHFDHIGINKGLSQATVNTIIQDKEGFIWAATQDGLNKFDGYKFTVYRYDEKNKQSLSYNFIYTIYEDSDGYIWIGTDKGGLNRFDKKSESFIHFNIDTSSTKSITSMTVRSICEDKKGNLWIGTYLGINKLSKRFRSASNKELKSNKNIFQNFKFNHGKTGYDIRNIISSMICDRNGNIWIGTRNGLIFIDENEAENIEKWKYFYHNPSNKHSLSSNIINDNAIYEDDKGILWIGTDKGINKLNLSSHKIERINHKTKSGIDFGSIHINSIIQTADKTFWFGSNEGLIKYNKKTESYEVIKSDPDEPLSLSSNRISSIIEDRGGNLWIGTFGHGLNKLKAKYDRFKHYKIEKQYLTSTTNNNIWSIYKDSKNNLWLGTDNAGAIRFNLSTKKVTQFSYNKSNSNTISQNRVTAIIEDKFGRIWIGTNEGLNRLDFSSSTDNPKITRIYANQNSSNQLKSNRIRNLFIDKNENLWISTWSGGLSKLSSANNKNNVLSFNTIFTDYKNKNYLTNNFVRPVTELSDSTLWIGTYNGLNILFDKNSESPKKFINIYADPEYSKSLTNAGMSSILEDSDQNIWIGTRNGLNKLTKSQRKNIGSENLAFEHIRETSGMSNEVVYGILEDDNKNIWVSTNKGLCRVNIRTNKVTNYFIADGLQSDEFNVGAYYKDSAGNLFFGGINGYTVFDPDQIKIYNYLPPVYITDLFLFNKKVDVASESILSQNINFVEDLVLEYENSIFAFEFSALSFRQPYGNKYSYKLEGLHDNWIDTDHLNRRATFTNLSPGEYVFRVKASNDDNIWSDKEAKIKITILPPFWLTWWAKAMYVLVFISILYYFYSAQKKKYKQKQRELELEKELSVKLEEYNRTLEFKVNERTKELKKAKISAEEANQLKTELLSIAAHDLKNPLNVILGFSSLIKKEMPDNSESMLYLDAIKNSTDDMLDIISKLLDSAAIETGELNLDMESISINYILNSVISQYHPLAIKKKQNIISELPSDSLYVIADSGRLKEVISNIVSNAIKYSPLNSAIRIKLYEKDRDVNIDVTDNGPGISKEDQKKLFQKFQKLSAVPTGGESSTGLGLSISKRLIELHKGDIIVNTKKGLGSTFKIIIPLEKIDESYKFETTNKSFNEIRFKNQKVIVADDVRENRKLIIQLLEKYNLTIFEATDGKNLLELTEQINPDFIFCDINMPVMNGIDAVKKIRESEKFKNTPIVSVTSFKQNALVYDGFDGLIIKPVSETKLINNLIKYLDYKTIPSIVDDETKLLDIDTYDFTDEIEFLTATEKDNLINKLELANNTMIIEDVMALADFINETSHHRNLKRMFEFSNQLKSFCNTIDIKNIDMCLGHLTKSF